MNGDGGKRQAEQEVAEIRGERCPVRVRGVRCVRRRTRPDTHVVNNLAATVHLRCEIYLARQTDSHRNEAALNAFGVVAKWCY